MRPDHIRIRFMETRLASLKREILHLETKGKSGDRIAPLYREASKLSKEIEKERNR